MTSNEILMLAVGLFTGAQLTNLMHAHWASRDARRDAAAAQAAWKRAAGDRYLYEIRTHRLNNFRARMDEPDRDLLAIQVGLYEGQERARREGLL
ncbi:hypothetical protein [Streptomyces ardesiacus]|uniref:Uncharacterized protein n=1 Tax=Streptomyces ardesiacus TaxID=285564 RepID=A0ABW8H805_9ACTN